MGKVEPDDRIPPSDMGAEARILASILEEETVFDMVSDRLKPKHFYADSNKVIFEGMGALREMGDEITLPSVQAWLEDERKLQRVGGPQYLEGIYNDTPALLDPDREVGRVIDRYQLRESINRARRFIADAYNTTVSNTPDVVSGLLTDVADINDESLVGEELIMKEAIRRYAKKFQANAMLVQELKAKGLPIIEITTGITALDDIMSGLHRGNMTVAAGRPGMGKSALGYKLCRACAGKPNYNGKPMATAFFSLEMPSEQLVMRATCAEGRVNMKGVRDLSLTKEQWDKYWVACNDMAGLPIYIVDGVTQFSDIQARIRKLKLQAERDGYELVLVVLDYLQLIIEKQSGNQTRENVVSDISRRCKTMAKNSDVACVILAQLNRECEQTKDRRPKLHHLRESGSIEQDADDVIFLYREDYYNRIEADERIRNGSNETYKPDNIIEIDVAKQRNGPTGRVKARWSDAFTGIDNLQSGDEEFGYA